MTTRRRNNRASLVQVLVDYDGPQLALFKAEALNILGVAVQKSGYQYPMFCCELNNRLLQRYLTGTVDLLYVFKFTHFKKRYFIDFMEEEDGWFTLKRASDEEKDNDCFYPLGGMFARSHTHPLKTGFVDTEVNLFYIDGTWESDDFSRFHGKLSEVYSMTYIASTLINSEIDSMDKEFLKRSISDKNWQGGGSYLSFYADVKMETRNRHSLKVKGIQYNSPGYIDLEGDAAILSDVKNIVSNFISKFYTINGLYKDVYGVLKRQRLLRADKNQKFVSQTAQDHVLSKCFELGSEMQIPNYSLIFSECDSNVVIFSKLILSYCRRLSDVAKFYAEGRVTPEEGRSANTFSISGDTQARETPI
jgi:hypothetical protein